MRGIFIALLSWGFAYAYTVSLDRQGVMTEDFLRGSVRVQCNQNGRIYYQNYLCDSSLLRGGNFGYLVVTNGSLDADFVQMSSFANNTTKSSRFNALTGRSFSQFNLWMSSVFQRPLLHRGLNTIAYTFFKNNAIVAQGSFNVNIYRGNDLNCGFGNLFYNTICPNLFQACDDFFRRRNYCR